MFRNNIFVILFWFIVCLIKTNEISKHIENFVIIPRKNDSSYFHLIIPRAASVRGLDSKSLLSSFFLNAVFKVFTDLQTSRTYQECCERAQTRNRGFMGDRKIQFTWRILRTFDVKLWKLKNCYFSCPKNSIDLVGGKICKKNVFFNLLLILSVSNAPIQQTKHTTCLTT